MLSLHSDVQNVGLLCTADLFPVPISVLPRRKDAPSASTSSYYGPYTASSQYAFLECPGDTSPQENHQYSLPMPSPFHIIIPPQPHEQIVHKPSLGHDSPSDNSWDIVAYAGPHPIIENTKCTNALVGQTFVQSVKVNYQGRSVLMFVFAVGTFPQCRILS